MQMRGQLSAGFHSRASSSCPRVNDVKTTPRAVVAKLRPGPPDAPAAKDGLEWLNTILARFGPVGSRDRTSSVFVLDFEKPLLELDKRIREASASAYKGVGG